jgi:hypothetical protein
MHDFFQLTVFLEPTTIYYMWLSFCVILFLFLHRGCIHCDCEAFEIKDEVNLNFRQTIASSLLNLAIGRVPFSPEFDRKTKTLCKGCGKVWETKMSRIEFSRKFVSHLLDSFWLPFFLSYSFLSLL